jgi:hypothetical protein
MPDIVVFEVVQGRQVRKHRVDTIFVLVVFVVFAASVLMVLMLGGNIYKSTSALSGEGYDERTVLSYIWAKVKHSDVAGMVYLDDYEDITMLTMDEVDHNGRVWRTLIFYADGWLHELTMRAGHFPGLDAGQRIIRTLPLFFDDAGGGLIRASVDGRNLYIYPRQ